MQVVVSLEACRLCQKIFSGQSAKLMAHINKLGYLVKRFDYQGWFCSVKCQSFLFCTTNIFATKLGMLMY